MDVTNREQLRAIKTFPSLVKYLRDELDWPIESDDFDDLTFDYEPEELGIDAKTAAKIEQIKQLRPLVTGQPWGIFFVKFEPKRLPVVVMRRILRSLVIKKRQSARRSEQPSWHLHDLLFISSYGQTDDRAISFANFSEGDQTGALPMLRVLAWDDKDTVLHLGHAHETLKAKLRWPEDENNVDAWRGSWSSAFTLRPREVIKTSKKLAVRMAVLSTQIRNRANTILAIESESGPLRKLHKAFQEALIHDLSEDDFADMYAQTITYGLFAAAMSRTVRGEGTTLLADNLADMVPVTNPFLKDLLGTFLEIGGRKGHIDFDELGINDVIGLLTHKDTDLEAVKRDFGDLRREEDPVIHFYELFLTEYDRKKKIKRGVFYTPQPVVSFIVRSVDEILRTEFGLQDGLADTTTWGEMAKRHTDLEIPEGVSSEAPFVQILDPACGTGTFLVEVINLIYKTMVAKWKGQGKTLLYDIPKLWNEYVPMHLLPRLYGFELMMAPYTVAHMRIGLALGDSGYRFQSDERVRIYLTNSLEPLHDLPQLDFMNEALAHESRAANKVKASVPTTVVIGNPPYSGISTNMNPWIDGMLKGQIPHGPKVRSYYEIDGKPLGERKLWLQDDYVKFIRYAQWRIESIRYGVLGYICNHAYLDNPTFRGMRQQLLAAFPHISIVDLHGNTKKGERAPDGSKDVNVFDIEQGVAIALMRHVLQNTKSSIHHADLFGTRDSKSNRLKNTTASTIKPSLIMPNSPYYFFVPRDETNRQEYEVGWKINDIMMVNVTGIITARDGFVIDYDKKWLLKRVAYLRDLSIPNAIIRERYFKGKGSSKYPDGDSRGWKLTNARKKVNVDEQWQKRSQPCLYRPFDVRCMYYVPWMIDWPRPEVMRHMLAGNNLGLITVRQQSQQGTSWALVGVADHIIEGCAISNKTKEINYLFPLYLHPDSETLRGGDRRCANLKSSFVQILTESLGLVWMDDGWGDLQRTCGPEDVFHYVYGQFHSQAYRDRYSEFLKIDFPRVFLTGKLDLFRNLCQLGANLVALHLLEGNYETASWNQPGSEATNPLDHPITEFVADDKPEIARGYPKYDDGKVFINNGCWFDGVPENVWNFHVGGYQVCRKWLKDRGPKKGNPGRVLSAEDIAHYQKIVIALNETIRLMAEIDETINAHGGWPGAFITDLKVLEGQKSRKA